MDAMALSLEDTDEKNRPYVLATALRAAAADAPPPLSVAQAVAEAAAESVLGSSDDVTSVTTSVAPRVAALWHELVDLAGLAGDCVGDGPSPQATANALAFALHHRDAAGAAAVVARVYQGAATAAPWALRCARDDECFALAVAAAPVAASASAASGSAASAASVCDMWRLWAAHRTGPPAASRSRGVAGVFTGGFTGVPASSLLPRGATDDARLPVSVACRVVSALEADPSLAAPLRCFVAVSPRACTAAERASVAELCRRFGPQARPEAWHAMSGAEQAALGEWL